MIKLIRKIKLNKQQKWLFAVAFTVLLICVAGTSMSSLYLPDKMSNIISEGITVDVVYETDANGGSVYILPADIVPIMMSGTYDLSGVDLSGMSGSSGDSDALNIPIQMPKMKYENAGLPVTYDYEYQGVHYAVAVLAGLETDPDAALGSATGLPVPITLTYGGNTMLIPKLLRTVDGTAAGTLMQGTLVLESGAPSVVLVQSTHIDVITRNGIIMLAITLVSSILSVVSSFLSAKIGMSFGRMARHDVFKKVLSFSQSESDKIGTSSLITRSTNDITNVQMLLTMAMRMMLGTPFIFAGSLFMALNKDPQMTLVLLVSIPVVALFITLVGRKVVPIFKSMQNRIDNLTLVARENITGVRVIRAFGVEEREDERFAKSNAAVTEAASKAGHIMALLMPVLTLIMSSTMMAIMFIAVRNIDDMLSVSTINYEVIGNMMAVLQYVMQIMMSIIIFSMAFIMVPRATVSANRINAVLDSVNKIADASAPAAATAERGSVRFENVSFNFDNAEKPTLEDLTFECGAGETTAIIGSTGSGKSTVINLIPRLYDVTKGRITVDGRDIREMPLQELRSKIGFVPQKAVLLSGTIRYNILYGAPDQSEENLARAARIAQAEEFIEGKEARYDSVVEQGGANFSGGQKQRISIARAIARKPEIYIFDDSFSALDFKTDAELRKALKSETKDSTVIIVAQRIGTVVNADRIIVLDKGRIVGIGTHRQLMKSCEVYKELALSQLSKEELSGMSKTLGGEGL